jgi:uncharacterized glyoxalase superfamily protein PhnB
MKPTPRGWPRLSTAVYYDDAAAAIDWLRDAFGFVVRLKIVGDGGRIEHSELEFGEGLIMVGQAEGHARADWHRSPKSVGGGNTQSTFGYVDDVEAHCAQARKAGATIATEPKTTDYGDDYWCDRSYEAIDLEGHHWYFAQRITTRGVS